MSGSVENNSFTGQGFQQSGNGAITIGGNVTIGSSGATDPDKQCLIDLRSTDPHLDKRRIEETKGGLMHDVYRWILLHPDFVKWRNDDDSNLLWIKGDPGKGKTMLLCGLINELQAAESPASPLHVSELDSSPPAKRRRRFSKPSSAEADPTCICYFFCQATDSRLNNAVAVLRSLVFQLVDHQPHLLRHIRPMYDKAGKSLFEDSNAWYALSDILAGILNDPELSETILVVDALDECLSDLSSLLRFILSVSSSHPVKWVVSSRNRPNVESHLNLATRSVALCLELNAQSISDAVRLYIRHKVEQLAVLKDYSPELRDHVQRYLVQNSNDTFLWVALVCKELEDPDIESWDTEDKLSDFPSGLEPLYESMVNQLGRSDVAKHILSLMSVVYRPPTLLELYELADLHRIARIKDPNPLNFLPKMIKTCGSFLTLRGNTVYFVHQSAKDFLLRNQTASTVVFPLGMAKPHSVLYMQSTKLLGSRLSRNIYRLKGPGPHQKVTIPPDPDPLQGTKYSCAYWVDHLTESLQLKSAPPSSLDIHMTTLKNFMQAHFLHWLEALTLIDNSIHQGIVSILALQPRLATSASSDLGNLLYDAGRFILYHKIGIESNPLQLYSSALIFCPRNSTISQLYRREGPRWIVQKLRFDDEWDASLQTFEGHTGRVITVAWSQDGQQVASASTDNTIKVWNAISGTCLRTINCSFHAGALAFTDHEIVSFHSYPNEEVKFWDSSTGALLRSIPLAQKTELGSSVTLSPNGRRLASLCIGGSIDVWDTATGNCLLTIHAKGGMLHCMALGDLYVGAASSGGEVEVYDTSTGTNKCLLSAKAHNSDLVQCMAFSPDGLIFASASYGEVNVWDLARGICRRTFNSLDADEMAFSWDSRYLYGIRLNNLIHTCDLTTGETSLMAATSSASAMSWVFSPCSDQLLSFSGQFYADIIKTWAMNKMTKVGQGHRGNTRGNPSVALSSDGQKLAWSLGWDIGIYDVATGRCLTMVEPTKLEISNDRWNIDLQQEVHHIAFSHSGKQILTTARCCVNVLDVTSGQCSNLIGERHADFIAAAFTCDGHHVVVKEHARKAALQDKILVLGLTKEGAKLIREERIEQKFDSLSALSPQEENGSQQMASWSSREGSKIRVWEVMTGRTVQLPEKGEIRSGWIADALGHTGYSISDDGSWILLDNTPFLWVPDDYRPPRVYKDVLERYSQRHVAIASDLIAIGTEGRGFWSIKFSQ